MGSERKSSKDKSRKRRSASHSEDEEGQAKRHRKSADEHGEGSRKRAKKDKSHHKSSKRHRGEEKKSDKKHKKERSKNDRHTKADFKELSNDDYFSKNNEFATWLKEEKKKFFSDLSSDSARDLFAGFVEDWNSGKLESKYYEGITVGPRSSHAWKIKT